MIKKALLFLAAGLLAAPVVAADQAPPQPTQPTAVRTTLKCMNWFYR